MTINTWELTPESRLTSSRLHLWVGCPECDYKVLVVFQESGQFPHTKAADCKHCLSSFRVTLGIFVQKGESK